MATARRSRARGGDQESAAVSDWRETIQLSDGEPLKLVWIAADQLSANPENWRLHPDSQRRAFEEVFSEVGWAGASLFNLTTNRLVDGHLRTKVTGSKPMPVLVGRWSLEQERKILATLDPIANMAKADGAKLKELLGQVKIDTPDLSKMLTDLTTAAAEASAAVTSGAAAAAGESEEKQDGLSVQASYAVLAKCHTEADQQLLIEQFERNGLEVRALTVGFVEPEKNAEPAPPIKADDLVITRETAIKRSPRVVQLEGMFDVPPTKKNARKWVLNCDLQGEWNIGLVVGPSGSGKSTIARELFGENVVDGWEWQRNEAILDGFPKGMDLTTITSLLSSVGFSSPPAWEKPFHVLSNGEQFRVNLARTLAECKQLAVVDEFTSVVDRQVARIGSAAAAKAIRSMNRRFVAVTCHYDVVDWLQPDWVIDLDKADKHGRITLERRLLRRRPDVEISVRRVGNDRWSLFRPHHYLSGSLHRSAKCFVAEVDGRPAAFTAVLFNSHFSGGWWREHRTVCLPDFQGIGLGNRMSELIAAAYASTDKAYRSTTSHPSMVRHRLRSRAWRCLRMPSMSDNNAGDRGWLKSRASTRLTSSFQFVGAADPDAAKRLGIAR